MIEKAVEEPVEAPFVSNHTVNEAQKDVINCSKCSKIFTSKKNIKRHEKTCNGCHVLQCPTCLKRFNHASSKSKHIKNVQCIAPVSINNESSINNEDSCNMSRKQILDELAELKNEIKLKSKEHNGNNININNNINNSVTNTNNGVIVNHYLKPNIDFLNNMEYVHVLLKKSLYQTNKVIMECVRDTYNSEDRPENRSIKINLKSGFAEVNIGDKTVTVPNDDACYDVIFNMSKDIKKVVEDYSYEYRMAGSKVDDVIEQMEDVECNNVDTNKLYGAYVKAGLICDGKIKNKK
jgi:uncharacterized C2H2 Zn-finger protein